MTGQQTRAVAAVDLGATSGRVMLGVLGPGALTLHTAHRFENHLVTHEGHRIWDLESLWREITGGIRRAAELAPAHGAPGLSSIGVDSWAVDYALFGPEREEAGAAQPGSGERIGPVVSYRDDRTLGVADRIADRVDRERQYELTGIAQLDFATIYQLAADERIADLPSGAQLLLLPDAIGYLLTGRRRTETTNASSTGLLDVHRRDWAPELLAAAGVERDLFAPFIEAGTTLGPLLPAVAEQLGVDDIPVVAVASHDTASAVLAVPAHREGTLAYISSGTWSLIGLELPAPVATPAAREAGFTNEGGLDGSIRFLRNVAGMWLVSESLRQWEEDGLDLDLASVLEAAAQSPPHRFRLDPTDGQFLAPGRMADRVAEASRALDGSADRPCSPGELVRCVLESLAETYRDALVTACELAGVPFPERLHVVGGGSRNALLNQLTADALGIEVVAGPAEATALGNVAVQARALGLVPEHAGAIRELLRASVTLETVSPSSTPAPRGRA